MLMTSSSGSDMVAEVTWITTGRIRHVILMTLNDMLIKSVSILCIFVALHGIQPIYKSSENILINKLLIIIIIDNN